MDWQLIMVGAIVLGAGAYVARRWYRTWLSADNHSACAGCDCADAPPPRKTRSID